MRPVTTNPSVIAGLKCPPETADSAATSTKMIRPCASATLVIVTTPGSAPASSPPVTASTPMKIRPHVPIASASAIFMRPFSIPNHSPTVPPRPRPPQPPTIPPEQTGCPWSATLVVRPPCRVEHVHQHGAAFAAGLPSRVERGCEARRTRSPTYARAPTHSANPASPPQHPDQHRHDAHNEGFAGPDVDFIQKPDVDHVIEGRGGVGGRSPGYAKEVRPAAEGRLAARFRNVQRDGGRSPLELARQVRPLAPHLPGDPGNLPAQLAGHPVDIQPFMIEPRSHRALLPRPTSPRLHCEAQESMAGLVVYMCGTAGQTRQRRPACCGGSVHVHVHVLVHDPETQPNREGYP